MTNLQMFLALTGVIVGGLGSLLIVVKMYVDAKIDPIGKNVDQLVQYMVSHEGRISKLEERTTGKNV